MPAVRDPTGPGARPPVSAAGRGGASGSVAAALAALRRWWSRGWRYRPERRYMRGGPREGARPSAGQ